MNSSPSPKFSDSTMNNNNNNTTLTKLFVGGLPWETPKDALRDHFQKYGEIVEAVIISDKLSGKSKGYGFVTFKEAEAAKKACEDSATLIINGRRANCNLAFLGARRPNSNHGRPPNHVQSYYPLGTPASSFHHHAFPFYGYAPSYINYNHNQKMCYGYGSGGAHMNGEHVYPRQGGMAMYPVPVVYHFQHPTESMGVPVGPLPIYYQMPTAHFGPPSITPHIGDCFKKVV